MRGASHDRWPLLGVDSWLWSLEHSHLRVYLALTSLAATEPTLVRDPVWGEVVVGEGCVITSLDRLASAAKVTKAVVRSALRVLAAGPQRDGIAPAITMTPRPRGNTVIAVSSTAVTGRDSTASSTAVGAVNASVVNDMGAVAGAAQHSKQHTTTRAQQHREISNSTASTASSSTVTIVEKPSSRIELPVSDDAHDHRETAARQHSQPISPVDGTQVALFSDQDPDQRSTADLVDPEIYRTIVPGPSAEKAGSPSSESLTVPDAPKAAEVTKASRIPEQCWKAADYLRAKILDQNPQAALGAKPWSISKQTGLRLAWAEEFRLMTTREKRRLSDAKAIMDWLFGGQTAKFRFVVESPSSLRSKWDRIAAQMKEEATPRPVAAPPRPSSVPNRPLKEV